MKKGILWLLVFALAASVMLPGCKRAETQTALPYDNQIHPEADQGYISELFYRNDLGTTAPDPCVIQITDPDSTEYGYYYLYGTTDPTIGFRAYRNRDLTGPWEDMTPSMNYLAYYAQPGDFGYGNGNYWAPEVIYDAENDLYYMFFTGSDGGSNRSIGLAVAEEPYGPFRPAGKDFSKPLLDNEKMLEVSGQDSDWFRCIDPHPYVAPDGSKYLYFVSEFSDGATTSSVACVKMKSWLEPDYESFARMTRSNYYTVDGNWTDPSGSAKPDYESGSIINEGPYVYDRRNDDGSYTYYLCFSVNGYADKSYSVIQAVADDPMGPYRKLTEEEGGILLSTDWQKFDHLSGTGHHSFVEVDDDLFIVYHEHVARETGGLGPRDVAVDRVKIVKNENGDEVLYCNGPTWSLQPRIEKYSGYKNLAEIADVSVSSGVNAEALTDGLLSIYTDNTFVKEFEANKTVTITLSFAEYQEISAIMIYNSKVFNNSFVDIKRIEFDFMEGENKGTDYIENLAFDWDFYKMASINEMRPGGSAVAVFNPLQCNEIRITVELPKTRPEGLEIMDDEGYFITQTKVAISEIVVLGT